MGNRFPNDTCVFCHKPNHGVGEHVWPSWFIAEFQEQGPHVSSHAGVPYMKRDKSTPVVMSALPGVHVPACKECNSALDANLEKPAKGIVRRLLAHKESTDKLDVSGDESSALAWWILKVGLLAMHPDASYDHSGVNKDPDRPRLSFLQAEWLGWMKDGAAPPSGFSVFLTRRALHPEADEPARMQHILLPRLVVDGRDLNFFSKAFGFTGVNATIVWHPGLSITHAQVDARRAVRLWPDPHGFDFGALPQVHPKELAFWRDESYTDLTEVELVERSKRPLSVQSDAQELLRAIFDIGA
ncbi:hypothetical protein [Clavibacter sp. km1a]|uniref:hypothetical protein n=1 Tax=Clavibacter sp. km1a TaxID=3459136 RepID=UPI0040416160